MATNAELLVLIDQAIEGILERGQSYTIQGRTYTRASLAELRAFRRNLIADEATSAGSGIRVRTGVPHS